MFNDPKLNKRLVKETKEFYKKLGFIVDETGKMKELKKHLKLSKENFKIKLWE